MIDPENLEIKAEVSIDDAGTVTGIAWPFGSPDRVGDVIEKGTVTFTKSVPMIMEHDQKRVVGVWETCSETETGLEVKGRLFVASTSPARDAHRALKSGKIGGLSIGFRHDGYETRPEGGRVFKAITINEISLCSRPVHPGARVTEVKSMNEEIPMEHEVKPTPEATPDPVVSADEVKALKARLDAVEAKANRIRGANNNQPDGDNDNDDTEKKAFGSYLRFGAERMDIGERKALTVASAADGGYLAPVEFGDELIKLLREMSPVRQYANVIDITGSSIIWPRLLTNTNAYWVGETANRTSTGMTFEQVTIAPFELAAFVDVSNQLLADNAYALEQTLLENFSESFMKIEGLAFISGTGTGQPKGLLAASGIAEVKTGVAAAFPASNPADVLIGMYHKIPTTHAQNAAWLMNRNTLAIIRQWKDSTGRYLVLDPISAGGTTTLLGRPIVEMPDMPDIGAGAYPIIFGDLKGYRIVDRIGVEVLRDPYSLKVNGQTRFHANKRVGADVTHPDRFVKLKVSV